MAMEFADAPPDCKAAIGQIYKTLEAGGHLETLLEIAPALSPLSPRLTILGAIWQLGRTAVTITVVRKHTAGVVKSITRNRIHTICDAQILQHQGQPSLVSHWRRIRSSF